MIKSKTNFYTAPISGN